MFEKFIQAIGGMLGAARSPHLLYEENGRAGRIWYQHGGKSFDMYWEFGGGHTLVIIDVPDSAEWEAQTKLPLAERHQVLDFVARRVIRDKTSTGRNRYEIGPDSITIFD